MKRILIMLAAVALTASCIEYDNYLFIDNNIGFVQEDKSILCDNGVRYKITDFGTTPQFETGERIYATFQATSLISESPIMYEATLVSYVSVIFKETYIASEVEDMEKFGTDEIAVNDAWYNCGYLNLTCSIWHKDKSTASHDINLVYDDMRSQGDTLHVTIKHNANGDSYDKANPTDYSVSSFMSSFKVGDFFPEGKNMTILAISFWCTGLEDEDPSTQMVCGTIYK